MTDYSPHAAPRIPRLPGMSPSHLHPWRPPKKRKRAPIRPFIGGEPAVNRKDRQHEVRNIRFARRGETRAWLTCICGSRFIRHDPCCHRANEALHVAWNEHRGSGDET